MNYTIQNAKNRRISRFLSTSTGTKTAQEKFSKELRKFSDENNAMIWIIEWKEKLFRCIIQTQDGKNAFAWGANQKRSFYNMRKMFNLKYSA
jgi:hypothetical protein